MLEQIFQQQICICLHSITEDHSGGQCFELNYNGTVYSACRCTKPKIKPFTLIIQRDELTTETTIEFNTEPLNILPEAKSTNKGKATQFNFGRRT